MKRKPIVEIKEEIKGLVALKPTVRRTSMFGDNHHDAIDAQVEVLIHNLSEDDIYRRSDDGDWKDNVKDAALEARAWLDGEPMDSPNLVDSWKELVVKK
jgi:hypothetical protein